MSDPPPLPREIGRYRVRRWVGHGAMGRVLAASDPVLGRDVAIKVLREDLKLTPEQLDALLDRMRHEARASARVLHPNIVALFDMGEDPDLGLYLVFEYVEGPTLKQRVDEGPLPPDAAARLAREVGGALSTAHDAGVLHRDIKPENVILAQAGSKVADFGIARIPNSTLTADGGVLGTPAYSAPEAINLGTFSPASDQFSLAATLYEAISGLRAFPGEDAVSVATRIGRDEPVAIARLRGLDPRVDDVLARALSKEPAARYPSCRELGSALADALESRPRKLMPTLPDQYHVAASHRDAEKKQLTAGVVGLTVGAAIASSIALLWPAGDPSSHRPESVREGRTESAATPSVPAPDPAAARRESRPEPKSPAPAPRASADAGTKPAPEAGEGEP